MFCENCGARLQQGEEKCLDCGFLRQNETSPEISNKIEAGQNPPRRRKRWFLWTGGAVLIVGASVAAYFELTNWLGNHASANALVAAQTGDFSLAVADQKRAIRWNPRNPDFRPEFKTYTIGLQASEEITSVNQLLSGHSYNLAIAGYTSVQSLLDQHQSPLFSNMEQISRTGLEHANVGQIEEESAKSSNISTVASYYTQLTSYTDSYGRAAQSEVKGQLESLVTKAVQQNLRSDDFTGALQFIQTAMQSVPGDSTLSKLNHQVKAAQTAYEQKQQQIAEQSLAQAANLANLNANPILVTAVSLATDSSGNVVASGSIQDQGTNIIGNIALTIEFYDAAGQVVYTDYVGVVPDPLNPGQSASFSVAIPAFYSPTNASVTYATWLNE